MKERMYILVACELLKVKKEGWVQVVVRTEIFYYQWELENESVHTHTSAATFVINLASFRVIALEDCVLARVDILPKFFMARVKSLEV
jgi:hypothetical protein